jgi:hypothetical protein
MGVFSRDLTRLRNEIVALRSARQRLIHDLERGTRDRRTDVSQRLADLSKNLATVARTTKARCAGSISDLKRMVTDLQTGVRTDLRGIRDAWLGLGATSSGVVENRAGVEAGAKVEGSPSEAASARSRDFAEGQRPARRKRKH